MCKLTPSLKVLKLGNLVRAYAVSKHHHVFTYFLRNLVLGIVQYAHSFNQK